MIEIKNNEYQKLMKMIEITMENPRSEFEVVFKKRNNRRISRIDFINLFKTLKTKGYVLTEEPEILDIRYIEKSKEPKENNQSPNRITIKTIQEIKKYCKTNKIDKIAAHNLLFVKKGRFTQFNKKENHKQIIYPIYMNEYNFKFNLNYEGKLTGGMVDTIKKNLITQDKYFRLKKRYSFMSKDELFKIDLTLVKSSKKKQKSNLINFTRDLKLSETLSNIYEYECEIEYIGKSDNKDIILKSLINNIGIILMTLKQTNYIITNQEEIKILKEYCELLDPKKKFTDTEINLIKNGKKRQYFIGPKAVSIELHNIQPIDEDFVGFNIRKNYCVTDKSDGERSLLYISKENKVYLINNRFDITFTGKTVEKGSQSIMDGELITKNVDKESIYLYLIFDLYFCEGKDIRDRYLIKNESQKKDKKIDRSRIECLKILYENSNLNQDPENSKSFRCRIKDYFIGNVDKIGVKIFTQSKTLLKEIASKTKFEYETDGLIYTPTNLPVGGNPDGSPPEKYGTTWYGNLKWKNSKDNTIDFLVNILKERGEDGILRDKINYKSQTDEFNMTKIIKYKTLILKTGFKPFEHEYINPCLLIDDDKKIIRGEKKYIAKEFIPNFPFEENSHIAKIELHNDSRNNERLLCKNKDEIEDNTIVEMYYDIKLESGWRWIPRNVRYDKTEERQRGQTQYGNDFTTAQNIWKTYYSPITEEMITNSRTTSNISNYSDSLTESSLYYNRKKKRDKSKTKALLNFHNLFVKSKIINIVSKKSGQKPNLLDLACGKGGDIPKWIHSNINSVLGIDIVKDNIENINDGACIRYYKYLYPDNNTKKEVLPKVVFAVGDTSKNINDGSCSSEDIYKDILKIIFKNKSIDETKLSNGMKKIYGFGSNKFNIVSIQFAIHYYFENINKLTQLIENISRNTKIGGYFIGTSFDGKKIFDKLKSIKKGESIKKVNNGEIIWKIKKNYDNQSFNDDISSLNLPIKVYMETINMEFTEYLVNYDFLTKLLQEYGFELDDEIDDNIPPTGYFSDLFEILKKDKSDTYGDSVNMSDDEKEISFLNRYFIYKKTKETKKSLKLIKENQKIIKQTHQKPKMKIKIKKKS